MDGGPLPVLLLPWSTPVLLKTNPGPRFSFALAIQFQKWGPSLPASGNECLLASPPGLLLTSDNKSHYLSISPPLIFHRPAAPEKVEITSQTSSYISPEQAKMMYTTKAIHCLLFLPPSPPGPPSGWSHMCHWAMTMTWPKGKRVGGKESWMVGKLHSEEPIPEWSSGKDSCLQTSRPPRLASSSKWSRT